jgi:hypothetical protein
MKIIYPIGILASRLGCSVAKKQIEPTDVDMDNITASINKNAKVSCFLLFISGDLINIRYVPYLVILNLTRGIRQSF